MASLLLGAIGLLAACQAAPPSTPGAPPIGLPGGSPQPWPPPATPTPVPSPRYLPVGLADRDQLTARPTMALPVGESIRLRAGSRSEPAPGPLTWRLDPASAGRAALTPAADGICTVRALAPGAVRVIAEAPGERGLAVIAAIDPAAPARRLDDPTTRDGLQPLPGATVLRSARDWAAYWALARQASGGCERCEAPAAPAVDWQRESVVALVAHGELGPVLTNVDLAGAGRLAAVEPQLLDDGLSTGGSLWQAYYAVPRLPAGVAIDYACRHPEYCPPGGPTPMPSPDPFAFVQARQLGVGFALDLPAGWEGEPLTWSLAPRSAARATLSGLRLTPTAPGPLVLTARAGDRTARVLHAVAGNAGAARLVTVMGANGLTTPRVLADAAAWRGFWEASYRTATPTSPGAPTAPPPPPPAPGLPEAGFGTLIAFPGHVLVAIPAAFGSGNWNLHGQQVIATHLEDGNVVLVRPAVRLPGKPVMPARAPAGGAEAWIVEVPAADAAAVRGIVLDGFPEADEQP